MPAGGGDDKTQLENAVIDTARGSQAPRITLLRIRSPGDGSRDSSADAAMRSRFEGIGMRSLANN